MSNLQNHLNNALTVNEAERVDESIVLSAIVCSACIGYAFKGLLETEFMKSVGAGIGGLLGGLGAMFGGGTFNGNSDIPMADSKEMHALLKKKDADLTPKEKKRLQELYNKYNWDEELSEKELSRVNSLELNSDGGNDEDDDDVTGEDTGKNTGKDTTTTTEFTKEMLQGLAMTAQEANKHAKDSTEKEENQAMIDLLVACSYDKDGKALELDEIKEKMKGVVGDDKWEDFKTKVDGIYEEHKDSKEFKDALARVKKEVKPEDAEKFVEEAKEHAKTTMANIETAKKKQKEIDDKIDEIKGKIEEAGDDQEKLKDLNNQLTELNKEKEKVKVPGVPADPSNPKGGDKDADSYTNKEIEDIQDELADLDPEKDKEKIKEKETILKAVAKAKGKNENDLIPKIETKEGKKPIQKKVGPRGAKYYRRKDDSGWTGWVWYKTDSDITESNYESLKKFIIDSLN
jgi:hypothetical protein